jgi:hypothetical protein
MTTTTATMTSTFANAVNNQEARTENQMKARKSSANACVDLFYQAGALRGKDIIPTFIGAYVENADYALRIAQWLRDVRGGAGERQLFRDILKYFEAVGDNEIIRKLVEKTPELGRFDDLLVFSAGSTAESIAFARIEKALNNKNEKGLCSKWMPRQKGAANRLRKYLKMSPKAYRKMLVENTKVVEQKMCSNNWTDINFQSVPSVAFSRYKKAFGRHVPNEFNEFLTKVENGEASIHAGAIFPHDVIKNALDLSNLGFVSNVNYKSNLTADEQRAIIEQWKALPNYVENASIIPLVDVSGSMTQGINNIPPILIAISLGLYLSEKNTGKFKDIFLTFSERPRLEFLKGNIIQRIAQMATSHWSMNTNLHAAFEKILSVAVSNSVPQTEMPKTLLILSDMQFDYCVEYDDSAIEMIRRKYDSYGYTLPNVVFWNLNSYLSNVPVKFDEKGTALISGYSPSILKSILSDNMDALTPENIMLETIMNSRYDL